ncbi:KpsF/GutQ family sugar-phosphate isomerase [Desulfocurvibacter africanus]|jgi:arabinose-5-phosphate isomerase|uniref:KpsF/GutQ family protein n=2 Tax=Desulfocurvibacter africanus TaxID=873 RepID=F3YTT9_DESAF|nr:KpsF/GutQ family sugar-phosphate isomerase [Desulfocurvibacter africanus]EGJ48470.1 KpsF/GutQ family protein [Desulfocurvibacter africanus subsp. africanus str. Walvis Bay]EMG37854.1 KpsF/GutQ family protein [Desulfocurvibacter africanus PCS]
MNDPIAKRDWLALAKEVLDIEIEGLSQVRDGLDESFALAVEMLAACHGRVIVSGLGKSGLVGRKIAATMSSTGTAAAFLHPVEGAHGDLGMIRPGDVVLALSNSGETDELNAIVPSLKAMGAQVVAITGNRDSTLGRLADVVVQAKVAREACPLNLAPTASTTATLAVGDALAVCLLQCKPFTEADFRMCHPGGALGQRLSRKVGDMMHTRNLPVVGAGSDLGAAMAELNRGRLGMVAVVDRQGRLQGIFVDGDVRRLAMSNGLDMHRAVAEVMVKSPKTLRPEGKAAEAMDIMEAHQITVLPVVDDTGVLLGMLHLHDLLGKGRLRFAT